MTTNRLGWNLCGYRVTEELYRDAKTVVYRARQIEPQMGQSRAVVIKLMVSAYPTDRELLNFRHQYTISKNLDLPGVIRLESLEAYQSGYALVMEDFGGVSLEWYRQHHRLSPVDVLKIAIQLADTLHALGRERIVHKDIKPANILINPDTREVKLIDFSIASRLPRETPELVSPSLVEGTLAYLAPEQTGRMNRGIDYRTDFYALGVTLYELLTGKLPFEDTDPIDLIHAHLARVAVDVDRVNPEVPGIIAQIVAKLMAKKAEDRYQSAWGIKYDLERCLHQWETTGAMAGFELAQRDMSDRFTIPERLYGREGAVKILLGAFERVAAGGSELVLVAGSSGIGKTAVINEIHKPITREHGYFIKGKFDQFNRNLPLSGFVRAFQDAIAQLVSESDLQLAGWRRKILAAVGANGRVLLEAIPELEQIVGAQPAVAELSGTAAQQRFSWVFQRFIEVFTTAEHPLTIFLDDLQWADAASLESIELLMGGKGYLLILGAYRDNEVSPLHPLMGTIDRLQQAQKTVRTLSLAPLTFDDLDRLVADTLRCELARSKPLTELVALKTEGNPFFATQFLTALHAAGEIWFNVDGYWECDIVRVQALALSDDIVEFMAAQLQKLPPATQHVLKLAACIGDRFDLETLAIVSERSQLSVVTALWQGLQAGSILVGTQIYKFWQAETAPVPLAPISNWKGNEIWAGSGFRFLHDRVQQAAYSLIPESQKQQTHLQIGRLLLTNTPPAQQEAKLFEIVNHFNTAIALTAGAVDAVLPPEQSQLLARLNLRAAQKARAANAYTAAYEYARIGTDLLGRSGWDTHYRLILALHDLRAEAAFLKGDFEAVPALVEMVWERAKTPLDRLKSYETIIHCYTLQKQYQQAIWRGLEILQQLGFKFAPKPNKLILARALVTTKVALWGKSHNTLLNAPEITAPEHTAPMQILNLLMMPAFLCSQELMVVFITAGIQFTLRRGNTPWSSIFYSTYGIILSSLGDYNQSYLMGKLAVALDARFHNQAVTAQVNGSVAWFCKPWREHLRNSIPPIEACVKNSMESGNLTTLGLSACVAIIIDFYLGKPLDDIAVNISNLESLLTQSPDYSQQLLAIFRHIVGNLRSISSDPTLLHPDSDAEIAEIDRLKRSGEASALSTIYAFKTCLAYLLADIPTALIYADAQLPYEHADANCYSIAQVWMFDALTRLAAYPQRDRRTQKRLLQRVRTTQRQLLKAARLMPANYQHKYDLVAAEKCRVLGNFTQAIDLYDRAILGAKTHEFIQEEAIANECAAKFYLAWGKVKIAAIYLQAAYYCYVLWGATAKTNDLERRYPELLAPILTAQQLELKDLDTLAKITTTSAIYPTRQCAQSFDLATTIQAAQVLSSTIDLTELIHHLSEILLTNSGAQTCILVLPDGDDDRWLIRSQSAMAPDGNSTTIQLSQPLADGFEYPANLIYRTKNTRQAIDFDARQPLEISDLYLLEHQPASGFCLPIVRQERVLGVVYLEHRQTPAIFTDTNKTVITFLCTQAAIALDNANLYHQSQLDIADRKLMEVALRESEARYHQLISNVPGALYQFVVQADGTHRLDYISARCAELFELSPQAAMADIAGILAQIVPADRHSFERSIRRATKLGKTWAWEGRICTPSGQLKWIRGESRQTPVTDGSIAWDGILMDITTRKQAEIALRQSQTRYQKLADNIPGAIYQFRLAPDGEINYPFISSGCWDLFGLAPAAVVADADCLMRTIAPADVAAFHSSMAVSAQTLTPKFWRGRVVLSSGEIKWIECISRPERQPDGAIVWDGVMLDITTQQAALHQRKQAEIALRHSERRYQRLADNIPGIIYQFQLAPDGSMTYPYVSSGCEELLQLTPAAIVADSTCAIATIHPDDRLDLRQALAHSAQNLTPLLWEGRVVLANGEIKWIQNASRPERQPDGAIVWDGVMLDITTQQAALHQRQQAEIALAASQQKYYNLIQSIDGVVWEYDLLAERFNFVSDRAVAMLGYPISDWFEVNFWELHLHPSRF